MTRRRYLDDGDFVTLALHLGVLDEHLRSVLALLEGTRAELIDKTLRIGRSVASLRGALDDEQQRSRP